MTQASMDMETRPLPAGWKWVKLGDVVENVTNGCSTRQNREGKGQLVTRIETISSGQIDLSRTAWVDLEEITSKKYLLAHGDILFSHINSLARVGNCALYDKNLGPLVHGMNLLRIQPSSSVILSEFLMNVLKNRDSKAFYMSRSGQSVNQSSMNITTLKSLPIPLPPLAEQQRIAAILNEQMASVEQARKAAQERLEAAQALPAAYLREVFPSSEDELPVGWKWVKLGDVIESTLNGLYKPDTFYGSGIPILKMFNIGRLDGTWNLSRVDLIEVTDVEFKKFGMQIGDIMLNRVNSAELVGKCAVIDTQTNEAVFESKNMRIRLNDKAYPKFVTPFLNSAGARAQIDRKLKQIVGQATVNKQDVISLLIPLPSMQEQQRIASILNEQMTSVEQVSASIQQELDTIDAIPAALLRKAFNGEL